MTFRAFAWMLSGFAAGSFATGHFEAGGVALSVAVAAIVWGLEFSNRSPWYAPTKIFGIKDKQ